MGSRVSRKSTSSTDGVRYLRAIFVDILAATTQPITADMLNSTWSMYRLSCSKPDSRSTREACSALVCMQYDVRSGIQQIAQQRIAADNQTTPRKGSRRGAHAFTLLPSAVVYCHSRSGFLRCDHLATRRSSIPPKVPNTQYRTIIIAMTKTMRSDDRCRLASSMPDAKVQRANRQPCRNACKTLLCGTHAEIKNPPAVAAKTMTIKVHTIEPRGFRPNDSGSSKPR